jgi:hypothetical protein
MKKNIFLCATMVLCLLLGLSSCGNQFKPAKQEKAAAPKKEAKAKAPSDIFFYTSKHRADKYEPTEAKMGFGSQIYHVAEGEFKGNQNIREVWIAPQIELVDKNAFEGCTALEKVHFQGVVKVINDDAFNGCSSLKDLYVDTYTIGLDAFYKCTSLETVRLGEHIWWVRDGAFAYCTNLRTVLMGITMQKLEFGAFEGSKSIEEFSIPNDFKNYMFGHVPSAPKWKKIYLLTTEYYAMPKSCTPNKNCTLYVPDAFLAQFQADENWMKFGSIEPLSKSKYFTADGSWK